MARHSPITAAVYQTLKALAAQHAPAPTVVELAERLKVERTTIHRAVRRLAKDGRLERVGPSNATIKWRILDAALETAERRTKAQTQPRPRRRCLGCGGTFRSAGQHNRICQKCTTYVRRGWGVPRGW